jgi:hypothetical protein
VINILFASNFGPKKNKIIQETTDVRPLYITTSANIEKYTKEKKRGVVMNPSLIINVTLGDGPTY